MLCKYENKPSQIIIFTDYISFFFNPYCMQQNTQGLLYFHSIINEKTCQCNGAKF